MSGDQYDAPNQQVVRPDGSGPADEGSGGSARSETKAKPAPKAAAKNARKDEEDEA